jgi:hypothetical protein
MEAIVVAALLGVLGSIVARRLSFAATDAALDRRGRPGPRAAA